MKEIATLASGCFWCTEAVFNSMKGVEKVVSGYTGGQVENPTNEQVSTGKTGHAECIQVEFENSEVSFKQILEVFFSTHNPTTLNQQGHDIGTQYRSAVFYHNNEQKETAEQTINELTNQEIFDSPIVTEIVEFKTFYPAEEYHQKYFENNPNQMYCQAVINPKISKFRQKFSQLLK